VEAGVVRSARWPLRLVALIAYYTVVVVIVGPMCFSQADADPGARVPVRVSLSLAMRTKTMDIATFTTPVPMTVGVASDGTFTVPANALAFTPVDVLVTTPSALGVLTVQAAAMSDFVGTVNTATGTATFDGTLELLWSKPTSTYRPSQPQMLDCPVGPFAVHLSTGTTGGAPLSPQSLLNPTSRTATLVDSTLAVAAIPAGTAQCAGNESSLNQALSLPIVPPTTTTSTSTTTSVPASSTTTTVAPTTTSTSTTTTTTAAPATPGTSGTGGLGVALNPTVLAFEPSPSMVSTLTIATMPLSTTLVPATGTPTVMGPVTGPGMSTTPAIPATAAQANVTSHQRVRTVKPAKHPRHKYNANRHAQTDATTMVTSTNPNVNVPPPPLYFSPSFFGAPPQLTARNLLPASGPLSNLGDRVTHPNAMSMLFIALLSLPLVGFGLGLIASDLGWRLHLPGRRRRIEDAARNRSLYP
jgi:hypothetical protein